MSNPLFGIVAATRLDITAGSSSRAAYYALVAQYQFGVPIIYGRAPAELAATIGVPLYSQVGDPGIQATVPGVVVVSFPNPVPSVSINGVAYPISVNDAGGSIAGVNYVDPNGVLHNVIDWQWQISVEPYQQGVSAGSWNQQVLSYTGDGTAGRAIPTNFPLNTLGSRVAIWVFCKGATSSVFRHNGMPGSSYATQPVSTVGGIMSFDAGGFTVTDDAANNVRTNQLNQKYTAIVLQDTTTDNQFMSVGGYRLWPPTDVINSFLVGGNANGNASPPGNNDTGITDENIGQTLLAGTGPIVPTIIISTKTYAYSGAPIPAPDAGHPQLNLEVVGTVAARNIPIGGARQITQLWIFNKSGAAPFCCSEMTPPNSFTLGGINADITQIITALGVGQFTVGLADTANGATAGHYYYVAFTIGATDRIRQLFTTFKFVGNGGTVHVPVGFLPAFVAARQKTINTFLAVWRGFWQAGTDSTQFNQDDLPTDGITAFTATGFDAGSALAPNGVDTFGFALAGAGSVAAPGPFAPAAPTPFVPSGGILVAPAGPSTGQACKLGSAITPAI